MTDESLRHGGVRFVLRLSTVMPGLVPGIHVFTASQSSKDVDGT
jgi:hypothetical protein